MTTKAWAMFVVACLPFTAQAWSQYARTQQNIAKDAMWASHYFASEFREYGMQGVIDDIKKCYDTEAKPAWRCTYLDIGAAEFDDSAAKSLGLHQMHDFFSPKELAIRLRDQFSVTGMTQQQATAEVTDVGALMNAAIAEAMKDSDDQSGTGKDDAKIHHIPISCFANDAHTDMQEQIPVALHLSPDAAKITYVAPLTNLPRQIRVPAMGGAPAQYMLMCYVQVSWSNGLRQNGVFQEWQDQYGQTKVYFGDQPIRP